MTEQTDYAHLGNISGEPIRGLYVFRAAGCASCHTAPNDEDNFVLAGGQEFKTKFGTFYAPNISTSKTHGIGNWKLEDFSNALRRGLSPEKKHYYPIFPYTSYRLMTDQDLVDLWTFWQTLPATENPNKSHVVSWPFGIRSTLTGWKLINYKTGWVKPLTNTRGRYLVEVLGHCAECHTPRNLTGGLKRNAWMSGADSTLGEGRIPSIAPRDLNWTEEEIVEYLLTGFTPEYDVAAGKMAKVIEHTSSMRLGDLQAIAKYLKEIGQTDKY
ncbi:MAG: cytochrome c [Pseudomonadota bacterium]|nr:cytochrome c [Pseudomonadota bacterium]